MPSKAAARARKESRVLLAVGNDCVCHLWLSARPHRELSLQFAAFEIRVTITSWDVIPIARRAGDGLPSFIVTNGISLIDGPHKRRSHATGRDLPQHAEPWRVMTKRSY
jgi:hypothetical protein